MAIKARKYTDAQRFAVAEAIADRGMVAKDVQAAARAGELTFEGEALAPFEMPIDSIRSYARDLRRKRRGSRGRQLAQQRPTDAVEALRQRFVIALDNELRRIEAAQRQKHAQRIPERLQAFGKALRELDALNRTNAPNRRKEAKSEPAKPTEGASGQTSGLARDLLRDHRGAGQAPATAPDPRPTAPSPAFEPAPEPEVGSVEWLQRQRKTKAMGAQR